MSLNAGDDGKNHGNIVSHQLVLVVCGVPGCGKSTLASHLIDRIIVTAGYPSASNQTSPNFATVVCHHIEYDQLQRKILSDLQKNSVNLSMSEDEISLEAWRTSRVAALEDLSSLLRNHRTSTDLKSLVVIMDDNFHLRSMRKQVFQVCQKVKEEFIICSATDNGKILHSQNQFEDTHIFFGTIWMNTPLEICLQRNSSRCVKQKVPDESIHRIFDTFEPPALGCATWEANFLSLSADVSRNKEYNNTDSTIEIAWHFVQSLLNRMEVNPVPALVSTDAETDRIERERAATRASKGHQLDQWSRQWIKAVAQLRPTEAKIANLIRKDMLRDYQERSSISDVFLDHLPSLFVDRVVEQSRSRWASDEKDLLLAKLLEGLANKP